MLQSLKRMRGDKKGWYKVSDLRAGVEVAVPSPSGEMLWDEIVSITPVGRERVYDIEVEGTHNFVGNGIFAHNTYVLRANTMLAVEGLIVPMPTLPESGAFPSASSTLIAQIPPEVLTADGKGVNLYKLATYNLTRGNALAANIAADGVRITALETRVQVLESGAVSSANALSTSSLASTLMALGVTIKNGFTQFGTLIADQFVAATNSAGQSSAGTVTVLAGNTVAQISNEYVAPSTKIFVTFNTPVTGSWYVSDKQSGSFRVVLSAPQATDVSFDYFLVQTEGQLTTATSTTGVSPSVSYPGSVTPPPAAGGGSGGGTPPPPPSSPPATGGTGDTTAPVVTLVGDAAMQLTVGGAFTDPGATATDNVDGNLTSHITVSGAVDTATAGLYSLTYTATDAAGNSGSASRVVSVVAPAATPPPPPPADTPAP